MDTARPLQAPLAATPAELMATGAFAEAQRAAERVLATAPADLAARLIANQAAFIRGDYAAALAHVEAGAAHHPQCPDFPLRRARCLIVANDVAAARAAVDTAEALAGAATAPLWGMIGDTHALLDQFARAREAYARAIALDPAAPLHHFNRAVVARYLGDLPAAIADTRAALARDPDHAEAWLNLVHLARETPAANHAGEIAAALARVPGVPGVPAAARARAHLHYALAKCLEDLGDGPTSLAHLDAGARAMRGTLHYDVRADLAVIDAVIAASAVPAGGAGHADIRPIFVLGMPRSGSTVIERILTSHSGVGTVGESPAFAQAMADVTGADPTDGPSLIRAAWAADPALIGRRYDQLTAPWRGGAACFVDKLPGNHLHAGLIARALPGARIVHTTRDPLANCYGIYKTLFNRAYPFSYDLDELVGYYAAYRRLMAHWRALPGVGLIEVAHEALVESPEPVIRGLVGAVGLAWEPACLAFHENARPSTTQSASQVRAPLNRDGIDGWRRFAPLLAPLQRRLAAAGVAEA